VDVVEGEARNHGVERPGVVERLDRGAAEDGALGRLGIDRDDLVALAVQCPRQLALAAADLQYPRRRRGQLREYEVGELQ